MRTQTRRTSIRIVAAVVAAGLAIPVSGPALGSASARAGDADRPDTIRSGQLDRALERIDDAGAVGVTAEVVNGDRRWRGAAGLGERKPNRRASERAHFRAASVSKMFVATLAMQQVEKGRWSLDTTLGQALPGVWPGRESTTLRQLLSHTSGLPDYLPQLVSTATTTAKFRAVISQRRTDAELVRVARAVKPTASPGTYSYSNTNFVLVGMMLERSTGKSLERLVERRVLRPARMTESSWATTRRLERPRLKEYARLYGKVADLSTFHPSMFSGAGALVSTARDLNRFQLALSGGDLVARRYVKQMRRVSAPGPMEYGLGSYRLPDPCRPGKYMYGHDGGSWSTTTLSYSSPRGDRRVAVSMTGRDYDGKTASIKALSAFATKAMAQACGGKPVKGATSPAPMRVGPSVGALGSAL